MNKTPSSNENVRVHRLPNGFTIAMERLPYLHSAALGLWARAGSGVELPHESGLAHFLEHLFFKGTRTRNVHQLMEAVESRGGYLNASTGREGTNLYVRMLSRHVPVGVEVLADIARNSLFCDMDKERGVILEEISSVEDNPDELAHDLITEFHWPGHPLGRPVAGTEESVNALLREHVVAFYERWYTPEHLVFSIAGNFDEEAVLGQVTDVFGDWPAAPTAPAPPAPGFRAGVSSVERPISQVHVNLAFPGVPSTDPTRFACSLLINVLGGGSTSRLYEKIREEEGLAYNIFAYHNDYSAAGVAGVYQAVAPEQCDRACTLVYDELRRICDEPVPEAELEMNREQIKGSMLMSLENPGSRASRMATNLLVHGRVVPVEEVTAKLDAVTADDVQRLAQRTFRAECCASLVLGPEDMPPPGEPALS